MSLLLLFRLDFFHLCCIVVDFIPRVLRSVFKTRMSKKYGDNWNENISTTDVRTTGADEKRKLESKNIETWDGSLLGKMLLHSEHYLLVDNNGCGFKVDELKEGCEVLIQNGRSISRAKVDVVKPLSLVEVNCPNKKIVLKKNSTIIGLCTQEWKAVNKLCDIRNTKFAHCPNSYIQNDDLQQVVIDVKECCKDLDKSDDAAEIENILSGIYGFETYQCLNVKENFYFHTNNQQLNTNIYSTLDIFTMIFSLLPL